MPRRVFDCPRGRQEHTPSCRMLTLDDIRHLDAAEGWLERGQYVHCLDEMERIDYNNRGDARVYGLRWRLYNESKQHAPAAQLALRIQRRFPDEPAGYVWRSISLNKLGWTVEAYQNLERVAGKFDGLGIVPYLLAVYSAELYRFKEARDWLERAFATPGGKELKLRALEEKPLEPFWSRIGEI